MRVSRSGGLLAPTLTTAMLVPNARADTAIAEREAARDRAALLREQGDDVNASEQRVDLIHKHLEG